MTKVHNVSFEKMKEILKNKSAKYHNRNCVHYNGERYYHYDLNKVRDYYYGLESKTVKITSKKLIRELLWKKFAHHDLMDGKILHNGIMFDGGEIAKREMILYENFKKRKSDRESVKRIKAHHNELAREKVKEVLNRYKVNITQEAKDKAHLIAERMVSLTGPNEISMQGLNFKNRTKSPVIRDIIIPYDQEVSGTNCFVTGKGGVKTKEKIDNDGMYRTAWAHSHANMDTYHSETDNINLKGWALHGQPYKFTVNSLGYTKTFSVKLFPSIVFNALKSDPYVEVGARFVLPWRTEGNNIIYISKKNAKLNIINESNGINLNSRIIDNEIIERVNWPNKRASSLEDMAISKDSNKRPKNKPIIPKRENFYERIDTVFRNSMYKF